MRDGGDVTLMACGSVVHTALQAAQALDSEGVSARVINMHSLKPIDVELIVQAAEQTAGIVTVEEHNIFGGLGSAVAEVLVEHRPTRMRRIGIPDVYAGTGSPDELREKLGVTASAVAEAARKVISLAK
jgi:transketolase